MDAPKPISVLLIENNPDDVALIRGALSPSPFFSASITHASTLRTGLECLKKDHIDVVLMDLGLPDGRGLDTFEKAFASASHVPIIILTSFDDEELAMQSVRKGAQDYFVKGQVNDSLLRRAVLYAIERKKMLIEYERTEERLRASEARLRNITAVIGEGIYVLDREGRLQFMNQEAEKLLGWTAAELRDRNFHDVVHYQKADHTPMAEDECPVLKTINTGRTYRTEEDVFTRKDGTLFSASVVATPLIEDEGIVGSVAAFQDITDRKQAADELRRLNELLARQATTDPLTGIANRLKFNEALRSEIRRSMRYNVPLSLIMFDIDHFKTINDTYGHHSGDTVLRDLTKLVSKNVRINDEFARWGGEEFMIMVTNTSLPHAGKFAEKLRALINDLQWPWSTKVTCSFGVSQLTEDDTEDKLVQRVDAALYRAKANGRNRVEIA
jgi:diguanylate cyclase (GGDEF)-like protein/PAS domain S-box-containing protein